MEAQTKRVDIRSQRTEEIKQGKKPEPQIKKEEKPLPKVEKKNVEK